MLWVPPSQCDRRSAISHPTKISMLKNVNTMAAHIAIVTVIAVTIELSDLVARG